MYRVRWLDMSVVHLVVIHMVHLRVVIRIVLFQGSVLAVLLLVFVFSSCPNLGYMSMRETESIEDLKDALGCNFNEAIGTSQGKTSLDQTHALKGGEKRFQ